MRRKRVLFLINSLAGGGAERVMCTLLAASKAECEEFDVVFATLDEVDERYQPPDWIERHRFDCDESFWRSFLAMRELMARVRPDLVVSFLTRSNIVSSLLAPWFGAKSIISERANTSAHFPASLGGAFARAMVRLAYPRAAGIIAVSAGVGDDLADNFGASRGKIAVIANPVDIDAIRAKAQEEPAIAVDEPFILAVGRLTKSKNFTMLIAAFAEAGVPGKLVVLGAGGEEQALREQAATLGLADRVLFPGFMANPYALMRRASFFVLSSNAEGFPNGLVEAMAAGAPVIATNCASGPSEILAECARADVPDGVVRAPHGVLVAPDSVPQMVEALRLMQDEQIRRDYAEKGAARAAEFSVAKAKDRYWDVLRAALV